MNLLRDIARDYYTVNRALGQSAADGVARPTRSVDGRDRPRCAAARTAETPTPGPLSLCPICEATFHGYAAVCERCDG